MVYSNCQWIITVWLNELIRIVAGTEGKVDSFLHWRRMIRVQTVCFFCLHLLDAFSITNPNCSTFRIITANVSESYFFYLFIFFFQYDL